MPANPDNKAGLIAYWLEKQLLDPTIKDKTIWDSLGLTRSTFYRIKPKADVILKDILAKRRSEAELLVSADSKRAVKKGIKTRHERILILQEECNAIKKELKENKDVGHIIVSGTIKSVPKKMDAHTRAYLRRTLRELQAEISKIEGDYAPEKKEHDFPSPLIVQADETETLDLEKLPNELLAQIIALGALKK